MNTLNFNHTLTTDVTTFINGEQVGAISFNTGEKVSILKWSHTSTLHLDGKDVVLYAVSQEDALLKTRKYLLDYDCYES